MERKRIAFFVEGQTELFFINKLLKEIAGDKNIANDLRILRGGKKFMRSNNPLPSNQYPNAAYPTPENPKFEALIFDCGGDNYDTVAHLKSEVATDIKNQWLTLKGQGYTEIIGLRDLYPQPLSKLDKIQRGLNMLLSEVKLPYTIIVANREVEDWFLAECNHYACIDAGIIFDAAQLATLGFNPCTDDLTLRSCAAADDLKAVYNLVGKSYTKNKDKVERTVKCLDCINIYMGIANKFAALGTLIAKIDKFLTP